MSREQAIDILKNGYNVTLPSYSVFSIGRKYVSFGQLEPEVQEVAKEIGIRPFECLQIGGKKDDWLYLGHEGSFDNNSIYRIRPDYIDTPPKPTLLEPEIIKYLEDSTVNPGQWPEEVKRYALEIERYCLKNHVELFVYGDFSDSNSDSNTDCVSANRDGNINKMSCWEHRLRKGVWPPKAEELEYYEILAGHPRYYFVYERNAHPPVTDALSFVGFLGYAKTLDQKDNFQQHFTPDMKYVVLKGKP